jgi:hypothetical protein
MGLFTPERGDQTRQWVHAAAVAARQIADNRPAHRARRRIHTRPVLCTLLGRPRQADRAVTTPRTRSEPIGRTPKLATMPPLAHGPLPPGTARRPPGSFTAGRPSQAGWTDPARVHGLPPTGGWSTTRRSRVTSRTVMPLPHCRRSREPIGPRRPSSLAAPPQRAT